ncbi:FecR domain-containing protein [Bythopirellula polymerisocia]|uniref:FecR protein n=1 Tax=Bythopirellula polymerisocia TaxID=2528003 RepID=A0A5C6CVA2_9BACT|nr:FecR domain-containing protein [Bythopirellula polymerisocia]TWU28378.1 FecR protein [Bythopirellula polymerisocia]
MSPESRFVELDELLALMLDGNGLSKSQEDRLESLLQEDSELLDQFVVSMALVNDLHDVAAFAVSADGQLQGDERTSGTIPKILLGNRGFYFAALAACLLIGAFSVGLQWDGDTENSHEPPFHSEFVATVVSQEDWDAVASHPIGSRVPTGGFAVSRGAVELRFDSGPSLIVEGPARLEVRNASEAELTSGKVFFRDETGGLPFRLTTPRSRFIDHGTEYALSVNGNSDEVHVFSGIVERTKQPSENASSVDILVGGQAKRYSKDSHVSAVDIQADPTQFVRELANQHEDPIKELRAIESFKYEDERAVIDVVAEGGVGWTSMWWPNGEKLPGHNEGDVALRTDESLVFGGLDAPSQGGSLGYVGEWLVHRPLKQKVSLAENDVCYVSFLFRPDGLWSSPENTVKLIFQNPDQGILEHRIAVGIDVARGNIRGELCGVLGESPLPMESGSTYLVVMKIVAAADNPDQLMIRVFQPNEPISERETSSWTVTTPTSDSDDSYELASIYFNCNREQRLDELRIGSSWASVTYPWWTD